MDWSDLKIKKVNKTTRAMFGNMINAVSLDNSYEAEILFYLKQGGEYRASPYKISRNPFCEMIHGDEMVLPEFIAASTLPSPLPCPVPEVSGNLNLIMFSLKLTFFRVVLR